MNLKTIFLGIGFYGLFFFLMGATHDYLVSLYKAKKFFVVYLILFFYPFVLSMFFSHNKQDPKVFTWTNFIAAIVGVAVAEYGLFKDPPVSALAILGSYPFYWLATYQTNQGKDNSTRGNT